MRFVPAARPGIVLAAALLAACDGTGRYAGDRLNPIDVGGVYQVCTLTFTPSQTALPVADLLQRVIETAPQGGRPGPSVALSSSAPRFDLVYTHRGDNFVRQIDGEVEFGQNSVFLRMYTGSSAPGVPAELLMPPHLDLVYTSSGPRRLTAGTEVSGYNVNRADYARAAGITEEGLQPRIFGHVTALFSAQGCG
ncbi:MAG TPA: hypothetical protein VNP72_01575 [Longimicrobium sp.]|nr:hypothetical protein [Longimicrobium sp.]